MANSQKSPIQFPTAFFVDTSVLDALPEDLASADLLSFMDIVERFKQQVHVVVPDVVAREWRWHRVQHAEKKLGAAREAASYLRKYQDGAVQIQASADQIPAGAGRTAIARLKAACLRILPPPKIDTREITRRAVMAMAPFRERGRGFKDELVVLSMLERMERQRYATAVLVTQDTDFDPSELAKRFEPSKVDFRCVPTFGEAAGLLKERLDRADANLLASRITSVNQLVNQKWDEISAISARAVKQYGVSETLLRRNFGSGGLPAQATIEKLLDVRPQSAVAVSVAPKPGPDGRVPVILVITCEFDLQLQLRDSYSLGRLVHSAERKPTLSDLLRPLPRRVSRTVTGPYPVPATLTEERQGVFADLRIELAMTSP